MSSACSLIRIGGRAIGSLLLLLCSVAAAAAAPPPTTMPAPQDQLGIDPQAKELLDRLMLDDSLRLDGRETAPDRFSFRVTIAVPVKGGSTHSSTFLVTREGDEVAMLMLGADGRPFAFARNGLFAGFSPTIPGRLVVCTRGAPSVTISGDEADGDFDIELSFSGKAKQARVLVDLRSVIRTASMKLRGASYDAKSKGLNLTTPNSEIWIPLTSKGEFDQFPIAGLMLRTRKGFAIGVSDLTTQPRWPELRSVGKADIEKLNLPMHVLGDKEAPTVPLFVPPSFGRAEVEREASDRFRTLFPSVRAQDTEPATQKSGSATSAPARERMRRPGGPQVTAPNLIESTGGC